MMTIKGLGSHSCNGRFHIHNIFLVGSVLYNGLHTGLCTDWVYILIATYVWVGVLECIRFKTVTLSSMYEPCLCTLQCKNSCYVEMIVQISPLHHTFEVAGHTLLS